jgi:predicted AAA+ superfamily ATPase
MIHRAVGEKILSLAKVFPVVSLTGPRQSGKTTLVRTLFPRYAYVNLENLNDRLAAEEDPLRFLTAHTQRGVIIDETQKVPTLFSYLQGMADDTRQMGRFILTGSQDFLLLERITQSLAGRVAICRLLPFGLPELKRARRLPETLDHMLFAGGYPVLYDRGIGPTDYFPSYIQTYIERDVRSITNVGDLSAFQRFITLCAARVGQLVNLSSLGGELGINYKTVRSWLSILEASFIVFLLQPYHRNYHKRVVKQPKLYFFDTGLLCALLGLQSAEQLSTHYLRGQIFESFIIAEYLKLRFHAGLRPNAFFWRDRTGHEVDLLLEEGPLVRAVEIKAGETLHDGFFRGLRDFKRLSGQPDETSFLVYGGTRRQSRLHGQVVGWPHLEALPHR